MARTLTVFALAYVLLAACVTINVYFPAAAAEEAADRIISEIQGEDDNGDAEPQGAVPPGENGSVRMFAAAVLNVLIPPAHAQGQPDIDVSSPAIRKLVGSMEARFPQLKPYYDSGAIGLANNGTIEIHDRKLVPLPDRNKVNRLIADENKDRNALYKEIAKANGQPEWEADIRATFAKRWISRARSGWYYRNASGQWTQK